MADRVSTEQAQQAVGYMNNFLEKLRTNPDINMLNMFTFQEIANLHISMIRVNNFVGQATTDKPDTVSTQMSTQTDGIEEVVENTTKSQRSYQIHTI